MPVFVEPIGLLAWSDRDDFVSGIDDACFNRESLTFRSLLFAVAPALGCEDDDGQPGFR